MSLNTFFLSKQILSQEANAVFPLLLDPDDFKHFQVLRLNPGEQIAVVDASTDYFICDIIDVNSKGISVQISEQKNLDDSRACPAAEFNFALFQAMPKSDKLETIVRQCTEIGINKFFPFISSRSISRPSDEKAEKKKMRLQLIAKNAAMQSGRHEIPVVSNTLSVSATIEALREFDYVVIFWEEADINDSLFNATEEILRCANNDCDRKKKNIALVIGPEGGFSSEEIAEFKQCSTKSFICSLGCTILRTETAAVVASSLLVAFINSLSNEINSN